MSKSKSIYDIIFESGQPIYFGNPAIEKYHSYDGKPFQFKEDYGLWRRILGDCAERMKDDFGKLKVNAIYVNEQKKTVVVVFNNGHKKIVKCSPKDEFDAEVGFALAIAREFVGEKMKVSEFVAKKAKVIKAAPVKRKRRVKKPKTAENAAPKKRGRKPKAESQKEENK